MASYSEKNLQWCARNVPKLPKISLVEPKKKSSKRIAISKRSRRTRINYSQIDLATDSDKKLQCVLKTCQNGRKCYFLNQKKMKQRDSQYKNFTLVVQIDCKRTKEKSKLLVKCFVNSCRKNRPICARNVPKLPEIPLFEPRKKSKKRKANTRISL